MGEHIKLRPHYGERMIAGLIDIATGLSVIVTLGHKYPHWQFDWAAYCTMKDLRKRREQQTR